MWHDGEWRRHEPQEELRRQNCRAVRKPGCARWHLGARPHESAGQRRQFDKRSCRQPAPSEPNATRHEATLDSTGAGRTEAPDEDTRIVNQAHTFPAMGGYAEIQLVDGNSVPATEI